MSSSGFAGSEFGDQIVQVYLNLPLSADAALRVSGNANLRQGPGRNLTAHGLTNINRYGGRARLLWQPDSRFTINLIGDYARGRTTNGADSNTIVKASGPGEVLNFGFAPPPFRIDQGNAARLASCGITAREGNASFCTTDYAIAHDTSYGVSLGVDYLAGPFTLTSISAYRATRGNGRGAASNTYRVDPLIVQNTTDPVNARIDLYTQEFRVSSQSNQAFDYTVGVFASHLKQSAVGTRFDLIHRFSPMVSIPLVRSLGTTINATDDSLAVFGQASLRVTRQLRLIAGGRFTGQQIGLSGFNNGDLGRNNGFPYRQQLSTDATSYRFGAQYDVSPRTMAYVTAVRGYKGGQITQPMVSNQPPGILKPETANSYEAGIKSTLFAGWVLDLNAFYQKIGNFQGQQCSTVANGPGNTGALVCNIQNIDGVKSRGAEINLFGIVTRGLSLATGFIYARTTYPNNFLGSDGTQIGGTQLANAPRYKFTLSGE